MSAGPLRRVAAAVGLVALVPIASMLVQGALTPEEAAQRAVVVGLVVIVLGNLARRVVAGVLSRVERRSGGDLRGRQAVTDPLGDRSG
jgi:hypothetical protein